MDLMTEGPKWQLPILSQVLREEHNGAPLLPGMINRLALSQSKVTLAKADLRAREEAFIQRLEREQRTGQDFVDLFESCISPLLPDTTNGASK